MSLATAYLDQEFGTVPDLVRIHGRERPDAPALIHGDAKLSWGELDALADRIVLMAGGRVLLALASLYLVWGSTSTAALPAKSTPPASRFRPGASPSTVRKAARRSPTGCRPPARRRNPSPSPPKWRST